MKCHRCIQQLKGAIKESEKEVIRCELEQHQYIASEAYNRKAEHKKHCEIIFQLSFFT